MYSHFGNKWLNLYGGPMWKVVTTEQGGPSSYSSNSPLLTSEVIICHLRIKINIYCLYTRHA